MRIADDHVRKVTSMPSTALLRISPLFAAIGLRFGTRNESKIFWARLNLLEIDKLIVHVPFQPDCCWLLNH